MTTSQRGQTEASLRVPELDRLISGAREQEVSSRQESKSTHFVLVTLKGLHDDEGFKIPDLYRQVRRARRQHLASRVESNVVHNARVTFKSALHLSLVKIPKPNRRVFTCTGNQVVEGMRDDLVYFASVALHGVLRWLTGQYISTLVFAKDALRQRLHAILLFQVLDLLLQVHLLFGQLDDASPFLLEYIFHLRGTRSACFAVLWHVKPSVGAKANGCLVILVLQEVLKYGLIQLVLLLSC